MSVRGQSGFTLIELLVVIAIIGILSAVVLASLNDARAAARDAKRVSDLRNIKSALELYYNENGRYPAEAHCDSSIGAVAAPCPPSSPIGTWDTGSTFYQQFVTNFGGALPLDPINDSTYYYYYEPTNDGGQGYYFRSRLERGGLYAACGGSYENAQSWCH